MVGTQLDVEEPAAGEWLFQQEGKLFGPVPAAVLVARLERGELSAETEVASEGGEFRPLREVPAFVAHVARVEAHRKVQGELAATRRVERRRHLGRAVLWSGAAVIVGGAVAAGVIGFARARGVDAGPAEVQISAPLIAVAAGREAGVQGEDDGELYDYVEGDPRPARHRGARTGPTGGPPVPRVDSDGLGTHAAYDEAAMNRVIRSHQARLVACVREQAARDPAFRGEVPLTFTVENDGRVGKLWVDKPGYATGGFHDCLRTRLAEWRFPAFDGERPSISLSFKVGS